MFSYVVVFSRLVYMPTTGMMDATSSNSMIMNVNQSNLFNHQINAYKYLVRNQPIPEQHLMFIKRYQQQQQVYPSNAVLSKTPSAMADPRYNPMKAANHSPMPVRYYSPGHHNGHPTSSLIMSSLAEPSISLTPSISSRTSNQRITSVSKPVGIDVQDLLVERDQHIQRNIIRRIEQLEQILLTSIQDETRTRMMIELKALKLLNFQRQVRYLCVESNNALFIRHVNERTSIIENRLCLASYRNGHLYAARYHVRNRCQCAFL
jgi:hypothetical protein